MKPLYKIEYQGAPDVNSVYLRGGRAKVLVIDMKSKYCGVMCTGSSCDETGCTPNIDVEAYDRSLYLRKRKNRDTFTNVSFPKYKGWDVIATSSGRYSIMVTLWKPYPFENLRMFFHYFPGNVFWKVRRLFGRDV